MNCIILAAGYATRLYPLTQNYPKALLQIAGKPILDWLIDDLEAHHLVDQYFVLSNGKFVNIFLEWSNKRDESIHVINDGTMSNADRRGAVRDLALAITACNIQNDSLVMAGDNLLDFSLKQFVHYARSKNASCVMCYKELDPAARRKTAIIQKSSSDLILTFEEKPADPKGDLAVPPFYYYTEQDLLRVGEALTEGCASDSPGSFAAWLSKKVNMYAFSMPGRRYDIGTKEDFLRVQSFFQPTNRKSEAATQTIDSLVFRKTANL